MKKINNLKLKVLTTGLAMALGVSQFMSSCTYPDISTKRIKTEKLDLIKANYYTKQFQKEKYSKNSTEEIFVKKRDLNLGDTIRRYMYYHGNLDDGFLNIMIIKNISSIDSITGYFDAYKIQNLEKFFYKNKEKGYAPIWKDEEKLQKDYLKEKMNAKRSPWNPFNTESPIEKLQKFEEGFKIISKYSEDYWKIKKEFESQNKKP